MAVPIEMQQRLELLCKKYSIGPEDALKFVRHVTKSIDGYYLFDSETKIDLLLFSRVFVYYFEFTKDGMRALTRHISEITKISTEIDQNGIETGIFFGQDEGIEFSLPINQYSTWMGFQRTLKVYWANVKS